MIKSVIYFTIGFGLACIPLAKTIDEQNEKINRLKKERDMFSKLYRTANTNIAHFQDSINLHCICK